MYYSPADFTIAERVADLAQQRGCTPSQIALAWVLSKPDVTAPIVGASKLQHLDELVAAAEIRLDGQEIALLEASYEPHRILGHS